MFEWLWAEHLWFPEIQNVTWADLENRPGSDVYYPKVWDLHWSLVLGAVLLVARYFTSRSRPKLALDPVLLVILMASVCFCCSDCTSSSISISA